MFRGEVEPVSTEAVSDPQPARCVLTFEVKQKQTKTTTTASPPGPVRSVYTDWATVASERRTEGLDRTTKALHGGPERQRRSAYSKNEAFEFRGVFEYNRMRVLGSRGW